MSKFVDCRGVRIKLGDTIVYPVRRGATMTMKEATVFEVPGKGCTVKKGLVALSPEGKRVIIGRFDRCVVVSDFTERKTPDATL